VTSHERSAPDPARASARSRWFAVAIAAAYGVAVVLIGFWHTPVDASSRTWLDAAITHAHRLGAPAWFGYDTVESLANVVFFVPLGLLVVLFAGARWWWAGAAAGLVLSSAIETGQALFLPARYATLDDVLANTIGATFGALLGVVVLRLGAAHRRRRAGRPPASSPPAA